MITFQEQNNELIKNFLDRTFFNSWRSWQERKTDKGYALQNYTGFEFDLSDACELKCSYCYVVKFGDKYYPRPELKNPATVFKNAKIVMDWLWENQYRPKLELFGGDAFNQNVGFDIVEEALKRAESGQPICTEIVVPTNMNFLFSENRTRLVEDFIERGGKIDCPLVVSASVDGIFMEDNRSFRSERVRDEIFYDKLFKFNKKYRMGFHPMIYSNNIEKWWDNFMWFQEKFKEYGFPPNSLYLLEVRNAEWTEEQSKHLYEFMRKLANWVGERLKKMDNPVHQLFHNHWAFNTLSSPFSTTGRGLGCSLQSGIYLRMGDLTAFPCHRLMYDYFKMFRFLTKEDKIVDIEAISPELHIATNASDGDNFPMCEQCVINSMCSHGCLGAQFENTGDMFVPIPSACRMEFYRIKGIIDGFRESGMLDMILGAVNKNKINKVLRVMEEIK
jgi:radical SAM protein with 4Fe4S-binding SPASM domain